MFNLLYSGKVDRVPSAPQLSMDRRGARSRREDPGRRRLHLRPSRRRPRGPGRAGGASRGHAIPRPGRRSSSTFLRNGRRPGEHGLRSRTPSLRHSRGACLKMGSGRAPDTRLRAPGRSILDETVQYTQYLVGVCGGWGLGAWRFAKGVAWPDQRQKRSKTISACGALSSPATTL